MEKKTYPSELQERFIVRLPDGMRDRIAEAAGLNGRSMNSEIVARIAQSFQYVGSARTDESMRVLDLPKVIRIKSGNTTHDVDRILLTCRAWAVEKIVFAATENKNNHAVMVVALKTSDRTFLHDSSWLNMAREPRILEVAALFRELDTLGLLDVSSFCPSLIKSTMELDANSAMDVLGSYEQKPMNLSQYLYLLAGHGLFDINKFRCQ